MKRLMIGVLLMAGIQSVAAFSLLGPFAAWQTAELGYQEAGDIGGPMSLGEEYRWNIPIITYGFDPSFVNWFGTNGVKAVDAAVRILNDLPPVSQLSPNLSEFGTDTKRINYQAQALTLRDVKSTALSFLIEEMGLAEPERWIWGLRARASSGNPPITNYVVIQRNFDPITFEPTPYVNGVLYSYQVVEFDPPPPQADVLEFAVDPTDIPWNSVASRIMLPGQFYTGITRDDMGGLRYLLNPNNVNAETAVPGTLVHQVNTQTNLVLLTNLDLTLFNMRAATSPPAVLQAFYPTLQITNSRQTVIITNRLRIEVTNDLTTTLFTNTSTPLILTNQDFGLFYQVARTSPPPVITALFPNLVLTGTNISITNLVTIASVIVTNAPPEPWMPAGSTNFVVLTNYVTNLLAVYEYSFASNFMIFPSTGGVSEVMYRSTEVRRPPFGTGTNLLVTNVNAVSQFVARPSGGFIIRPPTVAGYEFLGPRLTNIIVNTNVLFAVTNTVFNTSLVIEELTFFTNVAQFAYPIEFVPGTPRFVTNVVSEFASIWIHEFSNVIVTNVNPNDLGIFRRIEITPSPLGPPNPPLTNIVVQTLIPVPTGGLVIVPTNLAGFQFTGLEIVSFTTVTNIVLDATNTITGERIQELVIYNFPEVVRAAFPIELVAPGPRLRPGVDKIFFAKLTFDSVLGTNLTIDTTNYVASAMTNFTTFQETHRRTFTRPDILFLAADLDVVTVGASVAPVLVRRSGTGNWANNAALNTLVDPSNAETYLAGPGVITPGITISFSKVGPALFNTFPGFTFEGGRTNFFTVSGGGGFFMWGSFDGTTNPPVVYPEDVSLESLEDIIFRRQP